MKTTLLYTAALFAFCSALPFYDKLTRARNQQTSNLCVSLSYSPSSDTALSYVLVCNTPGEGMRFPIFFVQSQSHACNPTEATRDGFFGSATENNHQTVSSLVLAPSFRRSPAYTTRDKEHGQGWERDLSVACYSFFFFFWLQIHASCHLFQDVHWQVCRT